MYSIPIAVISGVIELYRVFSTRYSPTMAIFGRGTVPRTRYPAVTASMISRIIFFKLSPRTFSTTPARNGCIHMLINAAPPTDIPTSVLDNPLYCRNTAANPMIAQLDTQ